jgi:hypothetical protein
MRRIASKLEASTHRDGNWMAELNGDGFRDLVPLAQLNHEVLSKA